MDEPRPGELARQLAEFRADIREDFAAVNQRLDRLVSADVYASDQRETNRRLIATESAVEKLVAALEVERQTRQAAINAEAKSRGDAFKELAATTTARTRWMVTAIVIPTVMFLANLYIGIKGVR